MNDYDALFAELNSLGYTIDGCSQTLHGKWEVALCCPGDSYGRVHRVILQHGSPYWGFVAARTEMNLRVSSPPVQPKAISGQSLLKELGL